jgi:hypothetical protein
VLLFAIRTSLASVGWANYQWPCFGAGYADNQNIDIYSQVWKAGCTEAPGQCPDLSATLYYKKPSDLYYYPVPMTFNVQVGDNDEFTAQIPSFATDASEPMWFYIQYYDASDASYFDPTDHCGGGTVPPMVLSITPATEQDVTVVFRVDMNCLAPELYSGGVFVAGDFQGWSACTSAMADNDYDGVYEGSWLFPAGSNPNHLYKHNRNGTDSCHWEDNISNRTLTINDSQSTMTLDVVLWDNWDCSASLGRCCYGNPCQPSCADNTSAECAALSGTWTAETSCVGSPCGSLWAGASIGKGPGGGSPLTEALAPADVQTINQAIDNIENRGGGGELSWTKSDMSRVRMKRKDIADGLRKQLKDRMDKEPSDDWYAKTSHPDGKGNTEKDKITIDTKTLNDAAGGGAGMGLLEEKLLHEWVHKTQTRDGVDSTSAAREQECDAAEIAYKAGILHINPVDNPDFRWVITLWNRHFREYHGLPDVRAPHQVTSNGYLFFVFPSEQMAGDSLVSYYLQTQQLWNHDLSPLAVTDMLAQPSEYPNGVNLLLCGLVGGYTGRIQGLSVLNGEVVGTIATMNLPWPIYSMTRLGNSHTYFLVDTSTSRIRVACDTNFDTVPDEIIGVFADAAQYPELDGLHMAEPATHPDYGFGVLTGIGDVDLRDEEDPYDPRFFMPDANWDLVADAVIPLHVYEFLDYVPAIVSPWNGNAFVDMRAQWRHDVNVYASDSSGQNLGELLGNVRITAGMDAIVPISRALNTGEYVIGVDQTTGRRPSVATPVVDPTPQHLVVFRTAANDSTPEQLRLDWKDVPGAEYYLIFASTDGLNFGATGDRVYWHNFSMPLPVETRRFYQVVAHR